MRQVYVARRISARGQVRVGHFAARRRFHSQRRHAIDTGTPGISPDIPAFVAIASSESFRISKDASMPATIVIVHDNKRIRSAALLAIRAAGHDVTAFDDPMTALNAVEKDSKVRVLVTRIDFGPGRLNGVALVQMLRVKQITQDGRSSLRPVFLDQSENSHHAHGVGSFVATPLDAQTPVAIIASALIE